RGSPLLPRLFLTGLFHSRSLRRQQFLNRRMSQVIAARALKCLGDGEQVAFAKEPASERDRSRLRSSGRCTTIVGRAAFALAAAGCIVTASSATTTVAAATRLARAE